MNATDTEIPLAEPAVPGDERIIAGDFEVVDKTLPATLKSTALAPLSKVAAGIAALGEKHGGKTYAAIGTVKGMQEAVADRLAIRGPIYEVPKIVKEQKAKLREVAAELEAFGERLIDDLKKIEGPITDQIDTETLRKKKAKEAAEKKAADKALAGQEVVDAIRNRVTLAVGQTPEAILELIKVCEAIEGDEETYGTKNGDVLRAKSETVAKLREMHATQVQWEETQRQARETQRKAALQSRIDDFGRIALGVIGKPSAAVQQAIADLEAMDITAETYAERAPDAIDAQQAVLKQLDTLLTAALAAEAAAATQAAADKQATEARAEADRLERQRKDQEQRDQEQAAETKRQEDARAALAQQQEQVTQQAQTVANARTELIANALAAIEKAAAPYNSAMSSEALQQAVQSLKDRKMGASEFGSKIGAARVAMAAAVAQVEAMLAEAINRECIASEFEAAALPPAPAPAPVAAPVDTGTRQFLGMFKGGAPMTPAAEPEAAIAALPTTTYDVREALRGLLSIVSHSTGVIGFNTDGTVAEWDEFEEVTRANLALKAADDLAEAAPF